MSQKNQFIYNTVNKPVHKSVHKVPKFYWHPVLWFYYILLINGLLDLSIGIIWRCGATQTPICFWRGFDPYSFIFFIRTESSPKPWTPDLLFGFFFFPSSFFLSNPFQFITFQLLCLCDFINSQFFSFFLFFFSNHFNSF